MSLLSKNLKKFGWLLKLNHQHAKLSVSASLTPSQVNKSLVSQTDSRSSNRENYNNFDIKIK